MSKGSHTIDEAGFDFMSNQGVEEHDRDNLGIIFALVVMIFITVSQYMGAL